MTFDGTFRFLSFGGGVQSTAMLILIAQGRLEPPDAIIMSDTGAELPETMIHVETVVRPFCKELGIPFLIARSEKGAIDAWYKTKGAIPFIGIRSCTQKFKIAPIRSMVREIVGPGGGKVLAECWLGITTDESRREIKSDVKWCINRFPLLQLDLSREDCQTLLDEMKWEVVKSGCFMCPYQSGKTWLGVREDHPELWERCLDLEDTYRKHRPERYKGLRSDGKWLRDSLDRFKGSECDGDAGCFL